MKSIPLTSYGRSCTLDNDGSSGNVDGSSKPGSEAWRQEESVGDSGPSDKLCDRGTGDRVWDEVEYLLGSLSRIKATLTDGTDWDPDEVKWINERYRLCKKQALDYILCLNLVTILDTVSFPGEHLTYLEVAKRVVVDCTEWELCGAIREIGLKPNQRVYFKVRTDLVSVESAEAILKELIGVGNYVLASEFTKELALPVKSATYTALKKELVRRGWVWSSKKVKRQVVKVISR
jgi:hypothetical protein